jgi:hypothetical protein
VPPLVVFSPPSLLPRPARTSHQFHALNVCSGQASHFPLVSELKSNDRRECTPTGGGRQLRDHLTRFSHGIVDDRVARAIYDFEFRDRSIRLDLEAHIDHEGCTGGDFTMRLVPGTLKPILDDLRVKTDIGFAIPGCRPVFMSLAVPGSLLIFVGFSATAPFPVLLLCVRTVFRFFGSFA